MAGNGRWRTQAADFQRGVTRAQNNRAFQSFRGSGMKNEAASRPVAHAPASVGYSRRPDLLRVGHEIACSFAHLERLALLVPPRRVTRISERAAQRAGMNMRVFDMESLALGWLGQVAAAGPADNAPRAGSCRKAGNPVQAQQVSKRAVDGAASPWPGARS